MNESAIELNEASPSVGESSTIDLDTLLFTETEPLERSTDAPRRPFPSVVIGTLVGLDETGAALVDFPENPADNTLPALATVAISEREIGRDVALLFQNGDPRRPLLVGIIQTAEPESALPEPRQGVEAELDNERIELTAQREIVLRCGKASITLTRAGKVLIRGAYVSSRSSGVNRIKGGSVHIN